VYWTNISDIKKVGCKDQIAFNCLIRHLWVFCLSALRVCVCLCVSVLVIKHTTLNRKGQLMLLELRSVLFPDFCVNMNQYGLEYFMVGFQTEIKP